MAITFCFICYILNLNLNTISRLQLKHLFVKELSQLTHKLECPQGRHDTAGVSVKLHLQRPHLVGTVCSAHSASVGSSIP